MTVSVVQPNPTVQRNIVVNGDGTYAVQSDADMKTSGTADAAVNVEVRVVRESDSTVLLDWVTVPVAGGVWSTKLLGINLDGSNESQIEVRDKDNVGDTDSKSGFEFGRLDLFSGQSNQSRAGSTTDTPASQEANALYSSYTIAESPIPAYPVPVATPNHDGAREFAKTIRVYETVPMWHINIAAGGYTLSRLRGTVIGSFGQQYLDDVEAVISSLENGIETLTLPVTYSDSSEGTVFGESYGPRISGPQWAIQATEYVSWLAGMMDKTIGDFIVLTASLGTSTATSRDSFKTTESAIKDLRQGAWYFADSAPYIHHATATQHYYNVDGVHWGGNSPLPADGGNYRSVAASYANSIMSFSGQAAADKGRAASPTIATISGSTVTLAFDSPTGAIQDVFGTPLEGITAYEVDGTPLTVSSASVVTPNVEFTVSGGSFISGDDILVGYLEDADGDDTPFTGGIRNPGAFAQALGTQQLYYTGNIPMVDSTQYTATGDWTVLPDDQGPAQDGTYTVIHYGGPTIGLVYSDTIPSSLTNGVVFLKNNTTGEQVLAKKTISSTQRIWIKSMGASQVVGVVRAS